MTQFASNDRLIKEDGYVLVIEEGKSPDLLQDMFSQISSLISGAEEVLKDLSEATLTGLQFVIIHYYHEFVSPSNFQGYGIVMLTIVPERVNEIIREVIYQAPDDDLSKIFLIAARHDENERKLNIIKQEATRIVEARIRTLRSL